MISSFVKREGWTKLVLGKVPSILEYIGLEVRSLLRELTSFKKCSGGKFLGKKTSLEVIF